MRISYTHTMRISYTCYAREGVLDAFEFVTFGAPEALCSKGVSYYEITLLASAKKGTNDVQAGFATADFRVLGDAAGHSPDGAHPTPPCRPQPCALGGCNPTLRAGRSPVHWEAATPRRRLGCSFRVPRRRRRCRVVGYRRCAEAQVVQGAGAP